MFTTILKYQKWRSCQNPHDSQAFQNKQAGYPSKAQQLDLGTSGGVMVSKVD